ncbi:riboflavin synthase [Melioribacteraceae bacterium 4301-Me]|uniref:riboflavin synthase n=1 Tax=Pyranulibacter aquaticus TaxID=3163344 RepID=UPI00359B36B8
MFTGIIEEVGKITAVKLLRDGKRIKINADKILKETSTGDSISVNGVCLTVIKLEKDGFWIEAVGETISKTALSKISLNEKVNLERALRLTDRLGGHIVLGHVNGIGKITALTKIAENYKLEIALPSNLMKYVVEEGSIAVDGISLTVAAINANKIKISIIPFTFENTNLKSKKSGCLVNIEVDILSKYLERLIPAKKSKLENQKLSDGLEF